MPKIGLDSLWRLGILIYSRLLFAMQIFVFAVRLCLKINFRHIAHQSRQSSIVTTSMRSALGCCRRSSLSQFGKLWGKWPCKTNGWTIVPENKFSNTIVFNHKSCIATICLRADNSTTPPPTERPRLWVQKKEKSFELLFWVPYDVLFSNEFLRDLGRLWALHDIVPDP